MRAEALLALLLAAAPSAAHDAGESATFAGTPGARFRLEPGPGPDAGQPDVVFRSGSSDEIVDRDGTSVLWDTVLIQGRLPDAQVAFEVRRIGDGGAPGEWTPLALSRSQGGRFWARASLPPAGRGRLQLRALAAPSGRDGGLVEVFGVEVFLSEPAEARRFGALPGPSILPCAAADPLAEPLRPPVVWRRDWGATAPDARDVPAPQALWWRITLHHSDGKYPATYEESLEEVRFIQRYHMDGRGWSDIGYHFLVDPLGNVFSGRAWSPSPASPDVPVLGAHTSGNNEGNLGIVLLGNYHPPANDAPTSAQREAVLRLIRYLVAAYRIPTGLPAAGVHDPTREWLMGHRDYKGTACPGNGLAAWLEGLRPDLFPAAPPVPAPVDVGLLRAAPAFD